MSRRKGKTNIKLEILNKINYIDKRLKKKKIRYDGPIEDMEKLLRERELLTNKLKTKR